MRWFQIRSAVWMTLVVALVLGVAVGAFQGVRAFRDFRAASQPTNGFTITAFDADYTVQREPGGTPTMTVVETIEVKFPHARTNHGIERTLPTQYRGRNVTPDLQSVTDETGEEIPVSERSQGSNVVWRIGRASEWVLGTKTYVITYQVSNVVQTFDDHQELYWDVNGDGWLQPTTSVHVTIHLDATLARALTGAMACYVPRGADCRIAADGATIEAGSGTLPRQRTLTVAIGFQADTVRDPGGTGLDAANTARNLLIMGLICALLALAYAAFGWWRARRIGGPVIVATAEPPDLSPGEVAAVLNHPERVIAAELLHAAVNGSVRLYGEHTIGAELVRPLQESSFDRKQRRKSRDADGEIPRPRVTYPKLSALAKGALASVFGVLSSTSTIGDVKGRIKRQRAQDLVTVYVDYVRNDADGLWSSVRPDKALPWLFAGLGALMMLLGWNHVRGSLLAPSLALMLLAVWISRAVAAAPVLSRDGQAQAAKIMGLRQFLVMTDTDRLRVLQAADTAERGDDDEIKVYEKLLGYAAALGVEKTWAQAMGRLPAGAESGAPASGGPSFGWLDTSWSSLTDSFDRQAYGYRGMGLRLTNAPAMVRMSAASAAVSSGVSSWMASSSTSRSGGSDGGSWGGSSFSSSGGSSGGGFSGGGGGGGGGGGW